MGGACLVRVAANVSYVFISERIQVLASQFFVNQFGGLSHKCSIDFLMTELLNICHFKQASLPASWLCIPFLRKISRLSLDIMQYLYFIDNTTSSFHIARKNFWKRNLKPLKTRRSFPFSLRITLATFTGSIFTPTAWDTTGTAEN